MKTNEFEGFRSVMESEVLAEEDMNRLEAGACDGGCKKSCKDGSQNGKEPVTVEGKDDTISNYERDYYMKMPHRV